MTTQYDVTTACRFAALAHDGQTRKGSPTPAFIHPRRVAATIRVFYPDALDLQAAAYLHDTVEDTDVTIDEVRDWFGADVAYLVDAVTNRPSGMRPSDDPRVLRLKAADLYDNITDTYRDIRDGIDVWTRFMAKSGKVLRWRKYVDHIVEVIGDEDLPQRLDEVLRRVEAVAPPAPVSYANPPRFAAGADYTQQRPMTSTERFEARYGRLGAAEDHMTSSLWDDITSYLGRGR
jgi:HD domain